MNPASLLRALLDSTDEAVQLLDADGRVVELNARARRAMGPEAAAAIGRDWVTLWEGRDATSAAAALERARRKASSSYEQNAAFAGAAPRWWRVTLSSLDDSDPRGPRMLVVMRDITAQKQSEENLRASEQRFDSAFDRSVMGIVFLRSDGVLVRVNDSFTRMVGYSKDELEGRTSEHFTHPDDQQRNRDAIQRVATTEETIRGYEKRYIHKDGHVIWTRISLSRVQAGEELTLVATVEDVTEQIRSQDALRDREQRLRLVFESVTDYAIFTLDPEGLVTTWNAGAERIFGHSANQIIGADSGVLWTPEDRERGADRQERRRALESGQADDNRWHVKRDGTRFFASGSVRPMWDAAGELQGFSKVCRDITAQRRAEQELAAAREQIATTLESERARLAEVFMRSPSFMAVLRGPEHRFELINDNYRRLVGTREIEGRTVRDALPEVVPQGFLELLDRVYQLGEEFVGRGVRVLVQRSPGASLSERFLDFVYRPLRNARGEVDGIFVHGNDITERKLAEKELGRLAEQRRLALGSAMMGWWQYDLTTGAVTGDERFCEIFGLPTECPYLETLESIHPEDRNRVDEAVRAATRAHDPQPYSIEYRIVLGAERTRWVRANGQTYYEGEGDQRRAVSFVGTIADITDSKLAEDALRESESRFRQLADAMPQIVFQAQPDGHVDYFNRRWYEYTGLPPGSVGFESWRHVHEPAALGRVSEVWMNALRTGSPYEIEYRLRRADGEFRWHLGRALPVKDADGNVLRWYGTNTDIHEQKQLQEQNENLLESERAARSEAERASQMKDEFLATLSHELRTPLNAILGWATILRDSPTSDDVAQGVDVIERNARAQTQIISDLLDMSRIISGKVRLDVQEVDVSTTIKAAIDTVRAAADVKGIRIEAKFDPVAQPFMGDPNRLQQVFWNLLSNAVKFTPRDGLVRVTLHSGRSQMEVSVEDSGEGIRPEFLPYVFDRFRQADASTTRRHGGLGLGLAIVRQLVELHGGYVRASSQGVGAGSTFTVTFPLTAMRFPVDREEAGPAGKKVPNLRRAVPMDLKGVKVLIVDDEVDARSMITRLLEGCEADVRSASSAQEALRLIEEEQPDVLVSDIGMPKEDGYSLIKRVRALKPNEGGGIPAVALTAYARPEDRMKAILAGFQFHVSKPIEPAELLAIVAGLVGRTAAE